MGGSGGKGESNLDAAIAAAAVLLSLSAKITLIVKGEGMIYP